MSPLELKILLHYHTIAEDYPELSPPAQQSVMKYFVDQEYLVETKFPEGEIIPSGAMRYSPTEKLHFFVDFLCSIPEPKETWEIPDFCLNKII